MSLVLNIEQNTNNRIFDIVYKANFISSQLLCAASCCRQILSYSSSPQIPGTCDSQACCYCSNFSLGVVFMFFLICVEQGFRKRSGRYICNYWGSLSHYNGINLLQDILNRTSPHKSDSRPAIATRRTESEWRIGKCCKTEKNCTCYILRVCGVCGLFFALHMR